MAVTSIDIDPQLLAEVKTITGAVTNREAVDLSLKRVIQIQHQLDVIERASDPVVLDIVSHMHDLADGTGANGTGADDPDAAHPARW